MVPSTVRRNNIDPPKTEVRDAGIGTENGNEEDAPNLGGGILCRVLLESEERRQLTCVRFVPMPLALNLRYLHTSPS